MGQCCAKKVSPSIIKDNPTTNTIVVPSEPTAASNHHPSLRPGSPAATPSGNRTTTSSNNNNPLPSDTRQSPARTPKWFFKWPLLPQSPAAKFGYRKNFMAKFELGEEVGRGHFGHTCCAKGKKGDLKNQKVAVKIISKAKMTSALLIEDVRREVKILKGLSGHPNLIKFYEAFEDAHNVYLVMELCEGGELLDRILSRGGRYSEHDAKAIVVQILSVVAFCHLQGVVHRDLTLESHPWPRYIRGPGLHIKG